VTQVDLSGSKRGVVYIDKMETHNSLRNDSIIGQRAPLYCTALGKSMLSGMAEDRIRKMYRGTELEAFTDRTITSVDDLVAEIETIRRRGWNVDDEEYKEGLRCIGAPIRDYRAEVIGAVSTSGYASVITRERIEETAAYVVKAARDISQRLGYRSG
jgi:IclR family KDG regulon transcriptional repressor